MKTNTYYYIYILKKVGPWRESYLFNSFILFLHTCYICVCFVSEHMWHKALLLGYSMRLELILVSSLNHFQLVRKGFIWEIILPFS